MKRHPRTDSKPVDISHFQMALLIFDQFQFLFNIKFFLINWSSLPIAIVTLTSEDEAKEQPQDQKEDSRNPFFRVRESQENEGTQERVVLVTIESQNSKVCQRNFSGLCETEFVRILCRIRDNY